MSWKGGLKRWFPRAISRDPFDRRAVLNIPISPSSRELVQPPRTDNSVKFHSVSCPVVARSVQPDHSLEKFVRRRNPPGLLRSAPSARNISCQEDSEILCLPCPAREKYTCPSPTCLFGSLLCRPFVTRSSRNRFRTVDWTTYVAQTLPDPPGRFYLRGGKRTARLLASPSTWASRCIPDVYTTRFP